MNVFFAKRVNSEVTVQYTGSRYMVTPTKIRIVRDFLGILLSSHKGDIFLVTPVLKSNHEFVVHTAFSRQ